MSHAEACWQEVEADKLRFGDLGRMPRRIVHPTQPHDRGWTNWIFAGWVPWRGHRAAQICFGRPTRQSAKAEVERLKSQSMTRVMEVYNYALPIDSQLAERRAWHI